jgi:glycosyltransferase involved in cell wall biosynthesis
MPSNESPPARKPRALVFIVAYHAETTIANVLARIPALEECETEVLVLDDGSLDRTFEISDNIRRSQACLHPLTVLANPQNQGYGGNQKIGYHYAIDLGFDFVALVHGDGQYAPELLPDMFAPLVRGEAEVVHGSRMLQPGNALRGGMPCYKFVGNKLLTWYQNLVLGSRLSEFHTGYKAYSVAMLKRIPFELNSNVFHFDTEIIIQFLRAGSRIVEIPIPTFYGDEICRVNGMKYALDVARASTAAWAMRYGLLYRRNFDVASLTPDNKHYEPKLEFLSTHSQAVADVPAGATAMDIGCGPGHISAALRAKGCKVIGLDQFPPERAENFDEFFVANLNNPELPRGLHDIQVVLLLDIIEHLVSPEGFCDGLRVAAQKNLDVRLVISTGNIGFFVTRLMLLLGQFNYSKRGILDLTHTRLFTFGSMRRLLQETGFVIEKECGIPAPLPLVIRSKFWGRFAIGFQRFLIKFSPGLFSYQIYMVARPRVTLPALLENARRHSRQMSETLA